MASPIPVLPDVPSMIVPPGLSAPLLSASSIIRTAMRSLIELPGLVVSIFASTVPLTSRVMELILTSGVCPMASRMLLKTFLSLTDQEYRVAGDYRPGWLRRYKRTAARLVWLGDVERSAVPRR